MSDNEVRNHHIFIAKLAEQAERFEEMKESMRKVALMGEEDLTVEERNLLSVAYKNVIGARRASWRIVSSIEQKEEQKQRDLSVLESIKKYREDVEKELRDICSEILNLLENNLIPGAASGESKVFYYKMQGDYHRYEAEFSLDDKREQCSAKSCDAYGNASLHAEKELPPTSPIRLGLALNYSVFYYEIQGKPDKACELAKKAFDGAISELDALSEESYKDSTLIMQLLRDNLSLWTSDAHFNDETERDETQDVEDN